MSVAGITRADFIADQLRGMSPGIDWNVAGIDRAQELARILDRAGVLELWRMKMTRGSAEMTIPAHTVETESAIVEVPTTIKVIPGFFFDYGGKRIGYLGTPDRVENDPLLQETDHGLIIAWSSEGHGQVNYVVRPNKAKTALEIAPVWASSSDAGTARQWITMIASFFLLTALPMAGVNVGAAIGNAVLPSSLTAAYPALSTAVGNVALSTALSGGDIQNAVKNTVVGAVAGTAGDFTSGALSAVTESNLIGSLASAATRAAITGGDIKTAIGLELFKQGATVDTSSFDFFAESAPTGSVFGDSFNYWAPPAAGDFSIPSPDVYIPTPGADPWSFNVPDYFPAQNNDPGDLSTFNPTGLDNAEDFDPSKWTAFPPVNSLSPAAAGTTAPSPAAPPENIKPPANSAVWSPVQLVQGISQAALAALSVVKAYRQLDQPSINRTARIVQPGGAVSAITSNGMIQTRSPSGVVTSTRPPVGVPQATVTGEYVVNNGDGTYTVVSPAGQSATYRYSTGSAASAGGISPAILVGGGVLLLLLLKR